MELKFTLTNEQIQEASRELSLYEVLNLALEKSVKENKQSFIPELINMINNLKA